MDEVFKMAKKYLFIINPTAGVWRASRYRAELLGAIKSHRLNHEIYLTQKKGDATKVVAQRASEFDVVVAVGGDGTILEVVNGLRQQDATLGLIPLGTGNDFARGCGVPFNDIEGAMNVLLVNQAKCIDLGEVNGCLFMNMLGLGFAGRGNQIAHELPRFLGKFKYFLSMLITFVVYRRPVVVINFDDQQLKKPLFLANIANGPYTAGGMMVNPAAKMASGTLELAYMPALTRLNFLRYLSKLFDGSIAAVPEISYFYSQQFILKSDEGIPVQVDGESDFHGAKELVVKVIPAAQIVIGSWYDKA
jgi:diacylglycerol kinase (ATP)